MTALLKRAPDRKLAHALDILNTREINRQLTAYQRAIRTMLVREIRQRERRARATRTARSA